MRLSIPWFALAAALVCTISHRDDIGPDDDAAPGIDEDVDLEEDDVGSDEDSKPPPPEVELDETADVVELSNSNLDKFLNKHEHTIVDFYQSWCGHCKDLEPKYEKAARILKAEGYAIRLAKIDCGKNNAGEKHIVEGYPTIKHFDNSGGLDEEKPSDWDEEEDGPWEPPKKEPKPKHLKVFDTKGIVRAAALQEFSKPKAIKEVDIEPTLRSTTSNAGQFALVARVKRKSARAKAYAKVATELAKFTGAYFKLYIVYLPKSADQKGDSSLFMWRPGFVEPDVVKHEFKGAWTAGNIAKWAIKGVYGTITPYWQNDMWNQEYMEGRTIDMQVAVLLDKDSEHLRASMTDQLRAATKKNAGAMGLLLDPSTVDESGLDHFNPRSDAYPILTVVQPSAGRFVLSGRDELAKADAVKNFLAAVKAKKAKTVLKSAPAPTNPVDKVGIVNLTADTFDEYVLDPKKDVLVYYKKPDCEYCDQFDPEFVKIAKEVQRRFKGTIRLAFIDTGTNGVEEEIIQVPKVVLYPAVKAERKWRSKVEFTKTRKASLILEFLENTAHTLMDQDL